MAEITLVAAFSTVPGGEADAIKQLLTDTIQQIAQDDGTFKKAKIVFTESDERCGLTAELDGVKKEGVPPTILQSGSLANLSGLRGHYKRVADKERSFANDKKRENKRPPSTLVIVKVHSKFDGAKIVNAGGATAGKPATASTPAGNPGTAPATASAVPAGDLDTRTGAFLAQVVKAKGGSVQRGQVTLLVSQAAMKETDRQDIAKRAADEAFLNAMNDAGGVLDASGDVVSLKYDAASKPQVIKLVS